MNGANADFGGINISFPNLTVAGVSGNSYSSSQASVSVSSIDAGATQSWLDNGRTAVCSTGQCTMHYLVADTEWASLVNGANRTFNLTVTPKLTGTFPIQIRAWVSTSGYANVYREPASGSVDQQGWAVYTTNVTVQAPLSSLKVTVNNVPGGLTSIPASGKGKVCLTDKNGSSKGCLTTDASRQVTFSNLDPSVSPYYYDVTNEGGAFSQSESWGRQTNVTLTAGQQTVSNFTRSMAYASQVRFYDKTTGADVTSASAIVPYGHSVKAVITAAIPAGGQSYGTTSGSVKLDKDRNSVEDSTNACSMTSILAGGSGDLTCELGTPAAGAYNYGLILTSGIATTDTSAWTATFTVAQPSASLRVTVNNVSGGLNTLPAAGNGSICLFDKNSVSKGCQPTDASRQALFTNLDAASSPYSYDVTNLGAFSQTEYWGSQNNVMLTGGLETSSSFTRKQAYLSGIEWLDFSTGTAFDSTSTVAGAHALRIVLSVSLPSSGTAGQVTATLKLDKDRNGTVDITTACTTQSLNAGGTVTLNCDPGAPASGPYSYGVIITLSNRPTDTSALTPTFAIGPRTFGTTVISHGYSSGGTWPSDWMPTMGCRILQNRAGNQGRVLKFNKDLGEFRPDPTIDGMCSPTASGGETILLFDWATESANFGNGFSEGAGDALFTALIRGNAKGQFGLDNLHFIGHSRGTVVNTEAVERLFVARLNSAIPGLPVSGVHVTNLDAHDWGVAGIIADDGDVNNLYWNQTWNSDIEGRAGTMTWSGTTWADSYWQDQGYYQRTDLAGRKVEGTYQHQLQRGVELQATCGQSIYSDMCHGDVVRWYTDTIENVYLPDQNGYRYSRLGGNWESRPAVNYGQPRPTLLNSNGGWLLNWLYNGDFAANEIVAPVKIGGWGDQGGGGTGTWDGGSLVLAQSQETRSHNYFYVPAGATAISFTYQSNAWASGSGRVLQARISDDTHEVQASLNCGGSAYSNIPLTGYMGAPQVCSFDVSSYINQRIRIRFTYVPAGGLDLGTVYIDSVHLVADATVPIISAVGASGITMSGATITWTTNEGADSQVEYGPTTAYGSATTLNTALVTAHSQALPGLNAAMLYHYRVKSKDAAGNPATSGDYTFTTAGDTTAAVISAVAASGITTSGATITWTTDENSDSLVEYGPTTAYGSATALNTAPVTAHSQALTGLSTATLYHYRVKSKDAAGNPATSGDYTFTTAADTTAPIISAVGASGITTSGATITWTTNESSDSLVEYGPTTAYGSASALNTAPVTAHSQALTGLSTATLYHYRVKSKDAAANPATSGDYTFTTSGDTTAPVISAVAASGITTSGATITWTTNESSDSLVEYGPTTAYGSASAVNTALVTAHSQALTGLSTATLYHYRVRSKDAAANPATSGDYTFTTSGDTTAPVISAVAASAITTSGATITWTTNEGADSLVEYGPTTAYGSATALNTTQVTAHSQALTGLSTATLYHYRVKSKDAAGNPATSGDYTFTTGDPPLGMTSSLRIASGVLAGQNLATSGRTIIVNPGDPIVGSIDFEVNSTFPSSSAMAMGITPNWGTHAAGYSDLHSFSTPVNGLIKTASVNLVAPASAGTYYIIGAFNGELNAAEVMSCTNWSVPSPVWNDGNDVADWSAATIEAAMSDGHALVPYQYPNGYQPQYVPATAVKVIVRQGSAALRFVPVRPCRVADTRLPDGPLGGPPIPGGSHRDFIVPDSACGVPSTAQAYSLDVVAVPSGLLGYLTVWPTGQTQPLASTLNSLDGRVKANAAIVPAGTGGGISVFATDTSHVVLDINGYFVPATDPAALAFYPLTPCRIADTRLGAGLLKGPYLADSEIRTFPVPAATGCNVPASARAYSLNFTAVPRGPLGYLTVWPSGQSKPVVSSLNAPTGIVTANAVIVPAGISGAIEAFVTNATDLVIDIDGYFAAPTAGGLSLYAVPPCRILDSRQPAGAPAIVLSHDVPISGASCGVPVSATAYVLNSTVIPQEPLGYLTLSPQGQARPSVSTLNALDATVTSNMAIVPAANGAISVFLTNASHLVLDISGYFAP